QLPLAELEAAAGAGGHHAHAELVGVPGVHPGVGQRVLGAHEGELGHAVGLRDEPAGQVLLDDEPLPLPGEAGRVALRIEARDAADAALPGADGPPVLPRAEPVGGHDADARHHGLRAPWAHAALLSGRARTIALWKPPKPLPTVSTVSVRQSRAVTGT